MTRRIRSFVCREGRLTSGQRQALDEHWPTLGLDYQPQPLDFSSVFGQQAPVVLEIGFGMGHSLVEMAKNDPTCNYLGIEVHRPGLGACLMQASAHNVQNLRVIGHDAVEILEKMIPDASLMRVQIYFPDPWQKKRHHKRRLIQQPFLDLIADKLSDGGFLHLATDWENYAQHMLTVLQAHPAYHNVAPQGYIEKPQWRPVTKFEQRGKKLGHDVWDLMFKRGKAVHTQTRGRVECGRASRKII